LRSFLAVHLKFHQQIHTIIPQFPIDFQNATAIALRSSESSLVLLLSHFLIHQLPENGKFFGNDNATITTSNNEKRVVFVHTTIAHFTPQPTIIWLWVWWCVVAFLENVSTTKEA
jgi:hypothetical protein